MREHLRSYFPERFGDGNSAGSQGIGRKALGLLSSGASLKAKLECEMRVMDVFERSNELKLLQGAMRKYGCDFDISRHISCERCNGVAGAFDPDTKQIVVCYNETQNQSRIMTTIMHEMIHMFDYCRVKFDFNNLEHVACSEIRAANITYCQIADRLQFGGPGSFSFKSAQQYCVKDAAFASVKTYSPETSEEDVWKIMDKVFPHCYNDLEPFGRRATSGYKEFRQAYRERYFYGYV